MNKLFLLDAYALIFRAHYAFVSRPMRNADGLNTSAIFGFTKFLRDIIVRERPRYLGVAFDPKGGNFRHKLYPEYKANRAATPEDIILSVPYIKRILEAMCVPVLEIPGWEADDVIGTLSVEATAQGFDTFMVTPDKDYGQLVSDHAFIYKQAKNGSGGGSGSGDGVEIVDRDAIEAHYGVDDPRLVADILALWGDASDNVPGVPGIGEKGAIKLVSQFGSVENILSMLGIFSGHTPAGDDLSATAQGRRMADGLASESGGGAEKISPKLRENIVAGAEQLLLSKRLVTIDTAVPIDFVPSELEMCDPDRPALREIYNELGFNMFLREMATDSRSPFNSSVLCRPEVAAAFSQESRVRSQESANAEGKLDDETIRQLGDGANAAQKLRGVNVGSPHPPEGGADGLHLQAEKPAASAAPQLMTHDSSLMTPSPSPQIDLFSAAPEAIYETINAQSESDLRDLVERFSALGEVGGDGGETDGDGDGGGSAFAFAVETAGRDYFAGRIVSVSLCAEPDNVYRVEGENVTLLKPLFENPKIAKISHDIKTSMHFLRGAKIELKGPLFDTMIEGYLLDPEGYKHRPASVAEMLELHRRFWPRIAAGGGDGLTDLQASPKSPLEQLYKTIEEPLVAVLEAMEREGIRIDSQILNDYAKELSGKIAHLEARIRELTDEPTLNVNSSQQLGEALFGKMRLTEKAAESGKWAKTAKPKMTKTKRYSTDEETLTAIAHAHPVVPLILEYRGLKKLLSTYVEALPRLVNPRTGHIHTSYNQAVTATGRLSSTNPNLQNIPIREEQGRPIRRAFIPSDDDHLLLSADYSQVELRLMAHLSGDQSLIGAFRAGEDIHRATAARIFGVSLSEVTPEMRRRAKTANFGIIYGISAFGLAQRLSIPRHEATAIIDGYFRSYPLVKEYMDRVAREASAVGYVSTLFGRKRFLPDINSSNAAVRALARRNAINAPIQGSAADIMKIAMVRIFGELERQGLRSKMILQVHDEVVIDLLRTEQQQVTALVVDAMEHAARLSVRLEVDHGVGDNWLAAH